MKTPLLLSLFVTLIAAGTMAQPVITMNDNIPTLGSTYTSIITDYVDPGEGGANQTWNFSDLDDLGSYTLSIVNPEGQLGSTNFPNANFASLYEGVSDVGYIRFADNKYEFVGVYNESFTSIFTDPRSFLEFPLTYNGSYSDTYVREANLGFGVTNVETGSSTTTIDGYGTLTTPAGTFADVLRLTAVFEGTLDSYYNGDLTYTSDLLETTVMFIKADIHVPLLFLQEFTAFGNTTYSANYYSAGTVGLAKTESITDLTIFPSPATDFIQANFNLEQASEVTFNLFAIDGRMVSQLGKQNLPAGDNQVRYELPVVAAGIYMLQFTTPLGQHTERIVIGN